ncbi:MAG: outer membrane beta-barrel protein [Candidatus Kapabacteria bacterium]|nr:outer membrane beta-barrel protein [Candidatus Kapabacteria bacterium]
MKFYGLFLLLIVGSICSMTTLSVYAQDEANPLEPEKAPPKIFIGPCGGYNRVFSSGPYITYNDAISPCPSFTSGSANGFYAGLTTEFLIGDPKTSKSSIIARFLYNNMPANFTYQDKTNTLPVLNGGGDVVQTTTEWVSQQKYTTFDVDLMYRFNLGNTPIGFLAGPSIGFALTQEVVTDLNLLTPNNAVFQQTNSRTIRIEDQGFAKDKNPLRIAFKAGIQYEIILKRFSVIPNINYNFGITNIMKSQSWRVNVLQAGVDVRFAVGSIF